MCNLVEKYFIIGDDKFHSEIVSKNLARNWSQDYLHQMGHLVYIDTLPHRPIITSVYSKDARNKRESSFIVLLKTINTSDFYSILLFVSTYPLCSDLYKLSILQKKGVHNQLDNFLNETNGFLIYHYQLEHLFIMGTGSDKVQAEMFRKNINKKKVTSFEESKSIQIFGKSLYEIISERMKLSVTYTPNYYSSHLLFEYLNIK